MNLYGIVLMASLWPGLAAAVDLPVDVDRACMRLVEAAQARQLAGTSKRGQYLCEYQPEASARFVFALRWRDDSPSVVGSNLVGYYLVDAASGSLHDWNLGEDQPGEALPPVPPVSSLGKQPSAVKQHHANSPHHHP